MIPIIDGYNKVPNGGVIRYVHLDFKTALAFLYSLKLLYTSRRALN